MKKNFLKVAALLIAAMLMVVSCTQEIAPKNETSELVEARLGLAYGRDVTITNADGNDDVISYTYTLTPKWGASDNKIDNGTVIYGDVTDKPISGTFDVATTVKDVPIGPVTPGLWEIVVKGFVTKDAQKVQILEGKTAAYFVNGGSNTATVFVSPINTSADETVYITLQMQDLGDNTKNAISYSIKNLSGGDDISGSLVKGGLVSGEGATYEYKAKAGETEGIKVRAGYNTITFSTPSAGEGGITKTFLVIPGISVNITGSVYPSMFQFGTGSIKVVNMTGAKLSVTGATLSNNSLYELTNNTAYDITVDDSELGLSTVELPAGTTTGKTTYTWYVNGEQKKTGTDDAAKTYSFSNANAGDYTVTCTIQYEFTYTNASGSTDTYKWIGDASLGNIRVMPASTSTTN